MPFHGENIKAADFNPHGNEAKLLEGLRERYLYETAERFCADRLRTMQNLEEANTPEWNRKAAFFVMEQIRIMADRARVVTNRDRSAILSAVDELVNEWTLLFGESLESVQIRFQKGIAISLIAEMPRIESTIAPNPKMLKETAISEFRLARKEFESLELDLEKMIRESPAKSPEERYLVSLKKNVEFQLALVLKGLALSYPAESPEYIDGLQQARSVFRGLAETASDAGIVWKSRLETVACYRMLGEPALGAGMLEGYSKRNPPPELHEAIEVEKTRLALSTKNPTAALKIIETKNMTEGGPDAQLARLETYICMQAESAKSDPGASAAFRKQAMDLAREIERKHGPYWGRLGQIELAESLRRDASVGLAESETKIEAFAQLAEDGFKRERFAESIANYEAAEAIARASGRDDRAVELALTAAAVSERRSKAPAPAGDAEKFVIETMNRFLDSAKRYPETQAAPEAYLSGLDRALSLVREEKIPLEDYIGMLSEYEEFWPESPKADPVALQAARLLERSGKYRRAIEALAKIDGRSPEAKEAVAIALRCFRAILDETAGAPAAMQAANPGEMPLFSEANKAAAWFEKRLPGDGTQWNEIDFESALAAAELHIKAAGHIQKMQQQFGAGVRTKLNPEDSFRKAESLLASAMQRFSKPAPERIAYRDSLRVFTAAGLGKRMTALDVIPKNVREQDVVQILKMIDDLCVLARNASSKAKPELAEIRLEMLDRVEPFAGNLGTSENASFRRLKAESLYDTGRIDEINRGDLIFVQLTKERPDDLEILEPFAVNLSSRPQKAALEAALRTWREIKSLTQVESELWWNSNEMIVRVYLRLGKKAEAKRQIELLRILRPGMGDPMREKRFDRLYEEVVSGKKQ